MATDEIAIAEQFRLPAPMAIEWKPDKILPCCGEPGVLWGRSALGKAWAECGACGQTWPGYLINDDKQRSLWAATGGRKEKNAATAA